MTICSGTDELNPVERHLLLVDDEVNILRSLERALYREGYQIQKANNALEGLELLEKHQFGVIVSDHLMPKMTGVEFLSQVKERYPDTVRIILSGYIDLNLVTDAINKGAIYKFLNKPWEDDLLRANIKEAFQHHELRSENVRLSNALQDANRALETINQELEQRVEQKSREVVFNLNTLKLSQEMLENLSTAVIGIDNDATIVLANHQARASLINEDEGMVGRHIDTLLPDATTKLASLHSSGEAQTSYGRFTLACGIAVDVECRRMGRCSIGKGAMLVIAESRA